MAPGAHAREKQRRVEHQGRSDVHQSDAGQVTPRTWDPKHARGGQVLLDEGPRRRDADPGRGFRRHQQALPPPSPPEGRREEEEKQASAHFERAPEIPAPAFREEA